MFASASERDKKIVLENLEIWWKRSPMYKKKRLLNVLATVSQGTPYNSKLHASSRAEDELFELGVIRV